MEFTKLSDVEVVEKPIDSANVLIEENGVIKKAPKTAVGGAGGEADLVIKVDNFGYDFDNSGNFAITIESGSLESVADVLAIGEAPIVKVKHFNSLDDANFIAKEGSVYDCHVSQYQSTFAFTYVIGHIKMRILMDSTDSTFIKYYLREFSMLSEIQLI